MQTTDPSNFFRTETALAEEDARKRKFDKVKNLGSPIELPGKPLDLLVRDNDLWVAESSAIVQRVDLETGSVLQTYRGHKGPATSLCLIDTKENSPILASGSWDKTIKLWDTKSKSEISTTPAHSDFVKCLLVIPSLKLLVSGGSDKCIRFWDISNPTLSSPLPSLGYLSDHTRPIQCLTFDLASVTPNSCTLYTADTMGIIRVWSIERSTSELSCRGTLKDVFDGHRTGVSSLWFGDGKLWSASADETVRVQDQNNSSSKPPKPIILQHSKPVGALLPLSLAITSTVTSHIPPFLRDDQIDAMEPYLLAAYGDVIRAYDLSSGDPLDPDIVGEIDGHWFLVTALRVWLRKDGNGRIEVWVISASLDGTVRKWRFTDFSVPQQPRTEGETTATVTSSVPKPVNASAQMTEEEERELEELLDSD